jgi:hypothetical protein
MRLVDERGVALVIALLSMMFLAALGMALALTTSTESRISAAYSQGIDTFYAADAAFERALQELSNLADWNLVLGEGVTSTFTDGAPGFRDLPDATRLDLVEATARLTCGRAVCSDADIDSSTADRPWGSNNPRWQLYAHGRLSDMSPSRTLRSFTYVVVWVADDPLETDGQPLVDGDESAGANPGKGLLQVQAYAYGLAGSRSIVEATLRRADMRVRVVSWRHIRQ